MQAYPLLYLGPVNYYARLVREEQLLFEQWDHYVKQSYRNRCKIMGPNGLQVLSIPVKRVHGVKILYKDLKVDPDRRWYKNHWRSLTAAYAASPYFELLSDELTEFFRGDISFLVDLNLQLTRWVLSVMGINKSMELSTVFTPQDRDADPWGYVHPKKEPLVADPHFSAEPYHQVFSERHGFLPNLSILDLLFNLGPDSMRYLKACLKT